ncbi:MAG: HTTM domain-containing protein [Myxococcota bacterium]
MIARAWADWEAFWDEREHPISLVLVRILLGACWLYDFVNIWRLRLVIPLFGVAEVGGFSDALMRENTPWFYQLFPGTPLTARLLHAAMTLAALCLTVGFGTRISAAVLLFCWATFVEVIPYADRGIDTLSRLTLIVLMFSQAGRAWSVDALIRTGSFFGDGNSIPAWPRRMLILQLVLMYFSAGVSKVGLTWWPMGHFAALYFALQDPAVAAWDFSYVRRQPFFLMTQIGSAGTMVYQWTYPMVLVLMWGARTGRGGCALQWAVRHRLEWVWIAIGGVFHGALAISMNLGIFPWAMLALYPIWVRPDEFLALAERVRARFGTPAG